MAFKPLSAVPTPFDPGLTTEKFKKLRFFINAKIFLTIFQIFRDLTIFLHLSKIFSNTFDEFLAIAQSYCQSSNFAKKIVTITVTIFFGKCAYFWRLTFLLLSSNDFLKPEVFLSPLPAIHNNMSGLRT